MTRPPSTTASDMGQGRLAGDEGAGAVDRVDDEDPARVQPRGIVRGFPRDSQP